MTTQIPKVGTDTTTTATGSILLAIRIGEASMAPVRTAPWLANGVGSTLTVLHR